MTLRDKGGYADAAQASEFDDLLVPRNPRIVLASSLQRDRSSACHQCRTRMDSVRSPTIDWPSEGGWEIAVTGD